MTRHYVFYEREIHPCASWIDIEGKYPGGYFYSPDDDPQWQWGKLTPDSSDGRTWQELPIQQIPKEFRLQLLLLGVPM